MKYSKHHFNPSFYQYSKTGNKNIEKEENERQERIQEKQDILTKLMNNDQDTGGGGMTDDPNLLEKIAAGTVGAAAIDDDDDDEEEDDDDDEDVLIVLEDKKEESKHPLDEGEGDIIGQQHSINKDPDIQGPIDEKDDKKSEDEDSDFDQGILRQKTIIKGTIILPFHIIILLFIADNDLNYTLMMDKVGKAHPFVLVDGKRQKYPL